METKHQLIVSSDRLEDPGINVATCRMLPSSHFVWHADDDCRMDSKLNFDNANINMS